MPDTSHLNPKSQKPTIPRISFFLVLPLLMTLVLVACGENSSLPPGPTAIPTLERPRGETLFIRYCNVCHPGGGMGSGPSLKMLPLSREDVTAYIRHGKGRMPGFGQGAISDEDLTHLVDYVLALR